MDGGSGDLVFIPGGRFVMGAGEGRDHSPAHDVVVRSFSMERHEVTNARYLEFCQATGHRLPAFWGMDEFRSGPGYPDHPVVGVSWIDACAYAAANGMRLSTEAEWEYAARGGLVGKDYPNGLEFDPSQANCAKSKLGGPVAVGSYPPNGYGLFDMQGNVVEWVSDGYDARYYRSSAQENPRGPEPDESRPEPVRFRVIRGGGWHSGPYCSRVYYRNALPANWLDFAVGFRCVRDEVAARAQPTANDRIAP
jgi:formylglycine-generating enzyme required for sulfatase activity